MIDADISFFLLIFDNYTGAAGPSDDSTAASRSTRTPVDISLDDFSCVDSVQQELTELRQKLQAMKKQAITSMDQSRKSSEREKTALRQAQEALELKESAVADALRATTHEDYMLNLMTEASQDMAGV
jgi:tRNA U34 5-carboxymethylaminomethyl modifying GTPase MnmE/TrmE